MCDTEIAYLVVIDVCADPSGGCLLRVHADLGRLKYDLGSRSLEAETHWI